MKVKYNNYFKIYNITIEDQWESDRLFEMAKYCQGSSKHCPPRGIYNFATNLYEKLQKFN
ncbi:hypothetical protein LCGC14_0406630 [marine sediment metagenome]|uniref:Uncharacterized protein n=1 Tax=marine sediment metagenome TaxID=412755 RepID=A0A0F9W461_9ZZZZ